MQEVGARLREWQEAGLLTDEQVASIRAYEQRRQPAPPAGSAQPADRTERRTLVAEAIGYIGAANAVGAVALLLGQLWQDLLVGGRLGLVGVLTLLVAGGGFALRGIPRPPIQRLVSVLFGASVVGVGWLVGIVATDLLLLTPEDTALAISVVVIAVSLPLYLWRRRALPQLVLLASVFTLVGALLMRPALPPAPAWIGLLYWTIAVGWVLLGLGRWLEPARVATTVGAIAALLAVQASSFDDGRGLMLALGLVTAGALVGLAIVREGGHHLALGAIGLFVLVPQLVVELFGDAIGAPATMLVVGLLLVLLAVGIGRARREVVPAPDREVTT